MNNELREKIYSMSNSFLPLDRFYNDIVLNTAENYNKESTFKDLEIISNFILDLQKQLAEKDKEFEELKEWQQWYEMWHKKFQKQIEDLTTELETYRPTKLHGNGQCECFKCKQEGRQAREWTDWCSRYKGHTYCDDCLKEVLKEEQTPQTQLAIQELEKVEELILKIDNNHTEIKTLKNGYSTLYVDSPTVISIIDQQIKELKGKKDESNKSN